MEGRDDKGRYVKGNLFALGLQTSGRPPKYETHEQVAEKLAEYIEYEDSLKRPDSYSKGGKGIYTLSGASLYLGFASVTSMYDYEKKNTEFMYVLHRYRNFLTHWNEQKLYWGGTFAGAQFWLKNFGGYKDESEQTIKQDITANYGGNTIHTPPQPAEDTPSDKGE